MVRNIVSYCEKLTSPGFGESPNRNLSLRIIVYSTKKSLICYGIYGPAKRREQYLN